MTTHRPAPPSACFHRQRPLRRPVPAALFFLGWALLGSIPLVGAAEPGKKIAFDIPAGMALETFKQFSEQSSVQLLYAADDVDRIKTHAIKGDFSALDALNRML